MRTLSIPTSMILVASIGMNAIVGVVMRENVFRALTEVEHQISFTALSQPVSSIIINVVSSSLFAILLLVAFRLFLKIKKINALSGAYEAFEVDTNGTEQIWGTLELRYNLFNNRIDFELIHISKSESLRGEGRLFRDLYLIGSYHEPKNPMRTRYGAFFLCLSGSGVSFVGSNLFLDPNSKSTTPNQANVVWKKK